jgi:hypothetical protein
MASSSRTRSPAPSTPSVSSSPAVAATAAPAAVASTVTHSSYEKMPHDTQHWIIPDKYNKKSKATAATSAKKKSSGSNTTSSGVKWDAYAWVVTEKVHGLHILTTVPPSSSFSSFQRCADSIHLYHMLLYDNK